MSARPNTQSDQLFIALLVYLGSDATPSPISCFPISLLLHSEAFLIWKHDGEADV